MPGSSSLEASGETAQAQRRAEAAHDRQGQPARTGRGDQCLASVGAQLDLRSDDHASIADIKRRQGPHGHRARHPGQSARHRAAARARWCSSTATTRPDRLGARPLPRSIRQVHPGQRRAARTDEAAPAAVLFRPGRQAHRSALRIRAVPGRGRAAGPRLLVTEQPPRPAPAPTPRGRS